MPAKHPLDFCAATNATANIKHQCQCGTFFEISRGQVSKERANGYGKRMMNLYLNSALELEEMLNRSFIKPSHIEERKHGSYENEVIKNFEHEVTGVNFGYQYQSRDEIEAKASYMLKVKCGEKSPKSHGKGTVRIKDNSKAKKDISRAVSKRKLSGLLSHIEQDPLRGISRLISEVNVMDESLQRAVDALMSTVEVPSKSDMNSRYAHRRSTHKSPTERPKVHIDGITSTYRQLYNRTKLHEVKNMHTTDPKIKRADESYKKCLQQLEQLGKKNDGQISGTRANFFYKSKFSEAVRSVHNI